MWGYGDPSGWAWFVMSMSMLIFWVVVIGGIALVLRWFSRREPTGQTESPHATGVQS